MACREWSSTSPTPSGPSTCGTTRPTRACSRNGGTSSSSLITPSPPRFAPSRRRSGTAGSGGVTSTPPRIRTSLVGVPPPLRRASRSRDLHAGVVRSPGPRAPDIPDPAGHIHPHHLEKSGAPRIPRAANRRRAWRRPLPAAPASGAPRFEAPWRHPLGVVEVWRRVRETFPPLQLALVGSMATDDPEGWRIYEEIERETADEPECLLFTDQMGVANHEVNAFQRVADVAIQQEHPRGIRACRRRDPLEGHRDDRRPSGRNSGPTRNTESAATWPGRSTKKSNARSSCSRTRSWPGSSGLPARLVCATGSCSHAPP